MSECGEKRVLHLTLKKQYFEEIVSGEKDTEYRDFKPYWTKRIEGKEFDEIYFRHGYAKDAPFMRVEYQGWTIGTHAGKQVYKIKLGRILELKNHPAAGTVEGDNDA